MLWRSPWSTHAHRLAYTAHPLIYFPHATAPPAAIDLIGRRICCNTCRTETERAEDPRRHRTEENWSGWQKRTLSSLLSSVWLQADGRFSWQFLAEEARSLLLTSKDSCLTVWSCSVVKVWNLSTHHGVNVAREEDADPVMKSVLTKLAGKSQ